MSTGDRAPRRPEDRLRQRGGLVEALRPFAALYSGITGLRNAAYEAGIAPAKALGVPVVSVGNLTVGGTGKTPMVAWFVRELQRRGRRPGVLSRGYRAAEGGRNEEGILLEELLPGVPHVQRADRVEGGRELEAEGVDVVVLDDGFQHRRLRRDVDLVLVDATRPWGLPAPAEGGEPVCAVLPRGFLREAPRGVRRASAVVFTRCDQASAEELERLDARFEAIAPGVPRTRAAHRAVAVRTPEGRREVDVLRGREVALVSGLGNPEAFARTAREAGAVVVADLRFPDHHHYDRAELDRAVPAGATILCSAKDAVKLDALGVACLVLEVELAWIAGEPVIAALLDSLPATDARRVR